MGFPSDIEKIRTIVEGKLLVCGEIRKIWGSFCEFRQLILAAWSCASAHNATSRSVISSTSCITLIFFGIIMSFRWSFSTAVILRPSRLPRTSATGKWLCGVYLKTNLRNSEYDCLCYANRYKQIYLLIFLNFDEF